MVDIIAPTIRCPPDQVVFATSTNGAVVNYSVDIFDLCDPSPLSTNWPPSGFRFPIGDTTVYCTAVDAAGNFSSCSFKVTVREIAVSHEPSGIIFRGALRGQRCWRWMPQPAPGSRF